IEWSTVKQKARLSWLAALRDLANGGAKAASTQIQTMNEDEFAAVRAWWQQILQLLQKMEVMSLSDLMIETWHSFGVIEWCKKQPDNLQRLHALKQLLSYAELAAGGRSRLNLASFVNLLL